MEIEFHNHRHDNIPSVCGVFGNLLMGFCLRNYDHDEVYKACNEMDRIQQHDGLDNSIAFSLTVVCTFGCPSTVVCNKK